MTAALEVEAPRTRKTRRSGRHGSFEMYSWVFMRLSGLLLVVLVLGHLLIMNVLDGGIWRYGDSSGPETPMTNFGGSGTFGKHPLSMVATLACLRHLKEAGPKLQQNLNARTTAFVQRLNAQFKQERLPIHVEHFSSFFLPRVLGDRRFEAVLFQHLRHNGVHIYLDYPCFLSTAHTDADIDFLVNAFLCSVRALREGGCLSEPDGDNRASGPADGGGTMTARTAPPRSSGRSKPLPFGSPAPAFDGRRTVSSVLWTCALVAASLDGEVSCRMAVAGSSGDGTDPWTSAVPSSRQ